MSPSVPRLALLAALLACACSTPLQRPWSPDVRRPRDLDVEHVELRLAIDHLAGHVSGEVELTLSAVDAPLRQVLLDAVELDVSEVSDADGTPLPFHLGPETLVIDLPAPLPPGQSARVQVRWSAFPRNGLYFEGPSSSDPSRPWHVWSQGQNHEARHWMPCWDQPTDRASVRLELEVNEDLDTLCAGVLEHSELLPALGRRRDTWSLDNTHPTYLITIVVGDLAEGRLPGPLPLPVHARARDLDAALYATRHTAKMLELFAEVTGRDYPFPKYAQVFVDDFTAGGMENISATTMYDEGLHHPTDEPQVDISGLVAHELAHQWFGDLITCDGWGELWLNEGFSDWMELLWTEQQLGREEAELQARDYQHGGMRAEDRHSRPLVWPQYDQPDDMFDGHSYAGAAARIRLLRSELGAELFQRCLASYVERHAETMVSTPELMAVFSEVAGRDLTRFFDEWFYGTGYPTLEATVEADGRTLKLTQTQAERGGREVFHFGIDVAWSRGGVESSARVLFDSAQQSLPLSGQGSLDWVYLDVGSVLPGARQLLQDEAAWARQLSGADDAVARLIAARWFEGDRSVRSDGAGAASEAGTRALHAACTDSFRAVRESAARALALELDEAAVMTLLNLSEDDDPRVRVAAIEGLAEALDGDALRVVRAAAADPNGAVAVAAVRALVDADRPEAWSTLTRLLAAEQRGAGRIRVARDLVQMLPRMDAPEALPLLVATASKHPERWVRSAAVSALAQMDETRGQVVFRQLCRSLRDESHSVRQAAVRGLALDGVDARERAHLRALYDLEVHSGVMASLEALLP
ncbi:MAG: hypothetical protein DRQ55_00890 [Planctomycetota bacterium]|nr:MAG: hypothetical protein DRQ55_00890 [Planctomycetota bacterium]